MVCLRNCIERRSCECFLYEQLMVHQLPKKEVERHNLIDP